MLTFEHAHSPAYGDAEHKTVFVYAKFAEFSEELPFLATDFDCMDYGRDIHARAIAGEFGEVAPFVPSDISQPTVQGAQTL